MGSNFDKVGLFMIGPFPPPVHGMAVVNDSMRKLVEVLGAAPVVLNTSAPSLCRSWTERARRLRSVLQAFHELVSSGRKGALIYLSVSGGYGKLYEIAFCCVARMKRMELQLHHHCFSYMSERSAIASLMFAVAGKNCTHITQSDGMSFRLSEVYGVAKTVAISNVVFVADAAVRVRKRPDVLGYLSNISQEKGIFDFIDLVEATVRSNMGMRGLIAGPFQDRNIEDQVRARLRNVPEISYTGPLYGPGKDAFFHEIDVFVFPTRYQHETEGIVNHEALARGIPVIAFGRGCIPEFIDDSCGLIVPPGSGFVGRAIDHLREWRSNPTVFEELSRGAVRKHRAVKVASAAKMEALLNRLAGKAPASNVHQAKHHK